MEQADVIYELRSKHANLEIQLDEETRRPMPNQVILKQIKREKLKLKDRIAEMEKI